MRMQKSLERIHRQLKSQKTGEEYSLSSVVSDALQAEDIFLSHEIIRPNSRSSAPHFHIATDEIIYVLEGTVIAVESDTDFVLNKGDSIMFEKNSSQRHFLKNESNHDCQVLVIRKKTEKLDVEF